MSIGTELANGWVQSSSLCTCYSAGASGEIWVSIRRASGRLSCLMGWNRIRWRRANFVLVQASQSTTKTRRRAILLGRRLWSLRSASVWTLVCETSIPRRVLARRNIGRRCTVCSSNWTLGCSHINRWWDGLDSFGRVGLVLLCITSRLLLDLLLLRGILGDNRYKI